MKHYNELQEKAINILGEMPEWFSESTWRQVIGEKYNKSGKKEISEAHLLFIAFYFDYTDSVYDKVSAILTPNMYQGKYEEDTVTSLISDLKGRLEYFRESLDEGYGLNNFDRVKLDKLESKGESYRYYGTFLEEAYMTLIGIIEGTITNTDFEEDELSIHDRYYYYSEKYLKMINSDRIRGEHFIFNYINQMDIEKVRNGDFYNHTIAEYLRDSDNNEASRYSKEEFLEIHVIRDSLRYDKYGIVGNICPYCEKGRLMNKYGNYGCSNQFCYLGYFPYRTDDVDKGMPVPTTRRINIVTQNYTMTDTDLDKVLKMKKGEKVLLTKYNGVDYKKIDGDDDKRLLTKDNESLELSLWYKGKMATILKSSDGKYYPVITIDQYQKTISELFESNHLKTWRSYLRIK